MAIPIAIPIIATLLSIASKYAKNRKEEGYAEDVTAEQKKEMRRNALARAIGADSPHMPKIIDTPNTSTEDIFAALGDIGAVTSAQFMKPDKELKSTPASTKYI